MTRCPCCGGVVSEGVDLGAFAATLKLSSIERQLFELLSARFGAWVAADLAIDRIYGGDPDGGPENGRGAISSAFRGLRAKLRGTGLCIEYQAGRGAGERRLAWEAVKDALTVGVHANGLLTSEAMH